MLEATQRRRQWWWWWWSMSQRKQGASTGTSRSKSWKKYASHYEELHAVTEEEPSPNAPHEETMHELRQDYKYKSYHPPENLFTNISIGIKTRSSLRNFCVFSSFVSLIELRII